MKKKIGDLTLKEFKKNVCDKQNNCHSCKYWNSYDSECSPIPEIIRHYDNDEIEIEETENNICNTCRLNNQCPIDHKPNLQCPYNDYEKR